MEKFDLSGRFLPVRSQQGLLSCVVIAFCDAVWWELERGREPRVKGGFKPSVQFVYYNARKLDGERKSNAPVPPSTVMTALKESGVCDVELWPDEIRLYRERPSTEAYDRAIKLQDWKFEEVPQTRVAIRECLKSETPFFFCLRFSDSNSWSFEGGEISLTGMITLPEPGERQFRNHAMLAVGSDEEKELVRA